MLDKYISGINTVYATTDKQGPGCVVNSRVIAVALAVFAVLLLVFAIHLFQGAHHYVLSADVNQRAAEDQQHGLDGLFFIFEGGLGLGVLAASLLSFVIAIFLFFGLDRKSRKYHAALQHQVPAEVITPNLTQETFAKPENIEHQETSGKP